MTGDKASLACTVTVPLSPFTPNGSEPDRIGPSLPITIMVKVLVAGLLPDCPHKPGTSRSAVANRAAELIALRCIDLSPREEWTGLKAILQAEV